jgi:hypothetical protein
MCDSAGVVVSQEHAQIKLHAGQNETVDKHDDHEKGLLFPQDTLG